jgi:uncharacterized membrane protein YqgA involved in biofilm formation
MTALVALLLALPGLLILATGVALLKVRAL